MYFKPQNCCFHNKHHNISLHSGDKTDILFIDVTENISIIPNCSHFWGLSFQKYILGPKGSLAKWGSFFFFFLPLLTTKAIDMSASWHRPISLGTEAGLWNADDCSLHNSPGPLPGHSIVIWLFLDKPTQINIYSYLQVRGLNEPQCGLKWINYSM